jgi:hypothetical protein
VRAPQPKGTAAGPQPQAEAHRCYNEWMRQFVRSRLDRRLAALFALAACAALGLTTGAFVASGAQADNASIVVTYISPVAFRVKLGDGTNVTTGSTIPAGSYQLFVYDDSEDSSPAFSFTGPGVSVHSNLNSTGMGIDSPSVLGVVTLQTSASYQMQDSTVGASSLISFGTTSTATATVVVGTSSGSTQSAPTTSTPTTTTMHAATTPAAVRLAGSVSISGKPNLMLGGKVVKSLKAGRYLVLVADHSRKAGLIVGTSAKHTITLSKAAATAAGARVALALSKGKWFFEASSKGPKTWFRVT